jgi:hypothetical protein
LTTGDNETGGKVTADVVDKGEKISTDFLLLVSP